MRGRSNRQVYADYRDPGTGIHVVADPIVGAALGVEPLLTTLVLTTAAVQEEGESPGNMLFPEVSVPSYTFRVPVARGEGLIPTESVRTYGARIRTVRYARETRTYSLRRHTLQGFVDDDENLTAVAPEDAPAAAAALARAQLLMGLEVLKSDLVATDANFGLIITVVAGTGWNELSEAMLEDINQAALYLEGVLGIDRSNFRLALFNESRIAARDNPALRAALNVGGQVGFPSFEQVRQYLDVGQVWGSLKVYKESEEAAPVTLFPDCAILYYPGNLSRSASFIAGGDRPWGRTFTLGPGAALTPYYSNERTSTMYPFQKRERTVIIDPASAVKIKAPYQAPA